MPHIGLQKIHYIDIITHKRTHTHTVQYHNQLIGIKWMNDHNICLIVQFDKLFCHILCFIAYDISDNPRRNQSPWWMHSIHSWRAKWSFFLAVRKITDSMNWSYNRIEQQSDRLYAICEKGKIYRNFSHRPFVCNLIANLTVAVMRARMRLCIQINQSKWMFGVWLWILPIQFHLVQTFDLQT